MKSERFITVNGHPFHYIWLRDNCLCPECRDPNSYQKIYDISEAKSLPEPLSIVEENDKIIITWKEQPIHQSVFPISWLMAHANELKNPVESSKNIILWNKAQLQKERTVRHEIHSDSDVWMNQLFSLGFTILENIKSMAELESFLCSIGPIHETYYGRFIAVKPIKGAEAVDLAFSSVGHPLSPHVDLTYLNVGRVVMFLYCEENNASGGDSIVVDGYRVARDFRQNHPEYFNILAETPVNFKQFDLDRQYYLSNKTPILKLNQKGEVIEVYFSHKNFKPNLTFDKLESLYEAYKTFFKYLKSPDYQYCFRLKAGDCLMVQNFRILHGRKAYDTKYGVRHLEGGFLDWEYFKGRKNFRQLKHL